MGVDWTWPNELVEPGFFDLKNSLINLRQQSVYTDSLIYIAGYMPTALLEMKSPITRTHVLYKPELISSKLEVEYRKKSEILFSTDKDFDIKTRSIFFDWDEEIKSFNLIPFNELTESEINEIKNIHVSIMDEEDFPKYLSELQMGYLMKAGRFYGKTLSELYKLVNHGGGVLRENINIEDQQKLAFFMLSTGKLSPNQHFITYSTTLSSNSSNRPMLVDLSSHERTGIQILWTYERGRTRIVNHEGMNRARNPLVYLATTPIIKKDRCKFIIVQIEMSSGHNKKYYYIFDND
jgi:hypothetical protein